MNGRGAFHELWEGVINHHWWVCRRLKFKVPCRRLKFKVESSKYHIPLHVDARRSGGQT